MFNKNRFNTIKFNADTDASGATAVDFHSHAPKGEDLTKMLEAYSKGKKLPSNYVKCTRTGREITMFGDNLEKRIAKFATIAGLDISVPEQKIKALELLLTTFICKDVVKADKSNGIMHSDQPKGRAAFGRTQLTPEAIDVEIAKLQAKKTAMTTVAAPETAPAPAEVQAPAAEQQSNEAPAGDKQEDPAPEVQGNRKSRRNH